MTDIVERLRLDADTLWPPPIDLLREAANEIERLRAALQQIMDGEYGPAGIARRALEQKP